MKRHVLISFGICLFLIVLSGLFILNKYNEQVNAQKELLVSYVAQTKTQLEIVKTRCNHLPYFVKSFISDIDLYQRDVITEKYAENIEALENFYIENDYFIQGISVYSLSGDVFHLYRYNNESFIIDIMQLHLNNKLKTTMGVEMINRTFSIVVPVYQDDDLLGNVAVNVDLISLQKKLYENLNDSSSIWATTIFNEETLITFPLEDELVLSHEKDILSGVCNDKKGFIKGIIGGTAFSKHVVTYFENLMIAEHNLGIAFSSNISPFMTSAWISFFIVAIILIFITSYLAYKYNNVIKKYIETIKNKDEEINNLQIIYQNSSVGICVKRDNVMFTANDELFNLMDGYLSNKDIGKTIDQLKLPECFENECEQEYQGWEIYKYKRNGKEIHVGKRNKSLVINGVRYSIETLLDVTDMEQRIYNTIQSAITKSELLNRVCGDVKQTLEKIRNALILLMEQYPDEVCVAHIVKKTAELFAMLDDVQDYARIEAGSVEIEEIPFNILDEIRKLTDNHLNEVQKKGLELNTNFASSVTNNLVGDPKRFRQILNELVSNAVKYTEKGQVRISVEKSESQGDKILIKCSVEDTGKGIQKEKIKKLLNFDTRVSEEGNTIGLGIIIVKKLIDFMGGTMRVTSPSPISTDSAAPGTQISFAVQFYADIPHDKNLDYSTISSLEQLGVLLIVNKNQDSQYLTKYFEKKGIETDVFAYTPDSSALLMQKLVIDKDRYQVVIIAGSTSEASFAIADKINRKLLTDNCIYIMVDNNSQKGNYIKAKSFRIDHHFVKSNDLTILSSIFKRHFPNISL